MSIKSIIIAMLRVAVSENGSRRQSTVCFIHELKDISTFRQTHIESYAEMLISSFVPWKIHQKYGKSTRHISCRNIVPQSLIHMLSEEKNDIFSAS